MQVPQPFADLFATAIFWRPKWAWEPLVVQKKMPTKKEEENDGKKS